MPNMDKFSKGVKDIEIILSAITGIAGIITTLALMSKEVLPADADAKRTIVNIPQILSTEGSVTLNDATSYLENIGLKVGRSVSKANAAYKDCAPYDVVGMSHKQKRKVSADTLVMLYFVTPEVIEKSKQLFIESEERKAKAECIKAERRADKTEQRRVRGERVKKSFTHTMTNIQQGTIDLTTNVRVRINKLAVHRNKSNKSDI